MVDISKYVMIFWFRSQVIYSYIQINVNSAKVIPIVVAVTT